MSEIDNGNDVRGYLVDPFSQIVSHFKFEEMDIDYMKQAMQCSVLDVVRLGGDVIMFVDDNGLLYNSNRYFKIGNNVIAGRAIIATETADGGTVSCTKSIEEVSQHIEWLPEGYSEEPYMKYYPLH